MKICPSCQVENDADASFCKGCGVALADQAPQLPAPQRPQAPGQPVLSDWYYYKKGGSPERYVGPLSLGQLQIHAASETLLPEDFVWNPALPDWKSAAQYPDLFAPTPSVTFTSTQPNGAVRTLIFVSVVILVLGIILVLGLQCSGGLTGS